MSANVRPLHDRVLVKRLETEEQVRGGIIIPDTAKEKPQEAEVVAVGPGKLQDDGARQPMDVNSGDKVLIGKYSGSEMFGVQGRLLLNTVHTNAEIPSTQAVRPAPDSNNVSQ